MQWRRWSEPWAGPGTGFAVRLGLALAALAIGAHQNRFLIVAPWAAAIMAADLLHVSLDRLYPAASERWRVVSIAIVIAAATVAAQAVGTAAVPLTLVPAVSAGLTLGRWGALLVGWVAPVVAFGMSEATAHHALHGVRILLLVLGMMITSLIASSWHQPRPNQEQVVVGEAKDLLIRLSSLADRIDTGFDLPALGDAALEEIADRVHVERAAVLLRHADDAVPVGLHGHTRMPWAPPTTPDSALAKTWRHGATVRSTHLDSATRRYLLTVPLVGADGGVIGMIAMDRESEPFSTVDQHRVESVAHRVAPLVEVGVLFSGLRSRAALEERTRLARDMHDGVAQDLAALSFTVDMLVQQIAEADPLRAGLESLRTAMRGTLSDIRHQISTLRMVERPGATFGAILSATLQEFGTQTGARTTLTLDESPFRLPAHVEMQLLRLALDVLSDARTSRAAFVDWDVWLAAPNARLVLMHDGATPLGPDSFAHHAIQDHASLIVDPLIPTGLYIDVTIGDHPQPLGRRTLSAPGPTDPASSRVLSTGGSGSATRVQTSRIDAAQGPPNGSRTVPDQRRLDTDELQIG